MSVLVLGMCRCTTPDVADIPTMWPWCGRCGRDIHHNTLERIRLESSRAAAYAEREAKDILYSLGAP